MGLAVLDLETACTAQECGGFSDYKGLGISWGVLWCSWVAGGSCLHFGSKRIAEGHLSEILLEADKLVTFNGESFDLPLLRAHHPAPGNWQHVDLCQLVYKALGRRVSLERLAQQTLGATKAGTALHAPQLAKEGRWDEIASYCERDVMITLRLYEFACKYGYLVHDRRRIFINVENEG